MLRDYSALQCGGLLVLAISFLTSETVNAAPWCPSCQGNCPSCSFARDGNCPVAVSVASNAAVVAGTAAAGTSLVLADVVAPRWLKVFQRSNVDALQLLELLAREWSDDMRSIT